MKKFLSVVLALTMLFSMLTTASAKDINEYLPDRDPYLSYNLPISVQACRAGSSDYADSLSILDSELSSGVGVNFKATLDMEQIRTLFDNPFFTGSFSTDTAAQDEFADGVVTTEITVTVSYPGVTVENAATSGSLTSTNASLFEEVGTRAVGTDTVTITYKNKDSLKVSDLSKVNLCDVEFTLENAAKYTTDGYHQINITMAGSTTIDFATKDLNVEYEGSGSYYVSAATRHVLEVIPATPATCDTPGKKEGVWCTTHNSFTCGAHGLQTQEIVAPLGHKDANGTLALSKVERVEATCTKEGNLEHYVCLLCKKTFSDALATTPLANVKIPKSAHNLGTSYPQVNATCTEDGLTAGQKCEDCGYETERKIIPATGHNIVVDAAVEAKCITPGKTEGKHCLNGCGYIVEQIEIPALGHSYGPWEGTEATEQAPGEMTRTCVRGCGEAGESETKILPQLPPSHVCSAKEELAKIIPATCDTPGSKQNYCECGKPVGEVQVIAAKGHTTTPVAGRDATCTEVGIMAHFACSDCGKLFRYADGTSEIQNVEIPVNKSNHPSGDIRVLPAVAATCDKDGLTEGAKCTKCNTIIEGREQAKIAKLSDDPEANYQRIPGKAATCNENGEVEHWHCSICNQNYTIHEVTKIDNCVIPATGHAWGDIEVITQSTDTVKGTGKRVCKNDAEHEIPVELALAKHEHNEECEEILQTPTCTVPGKKIMRFTCCGKIDTEYPGSDSNGIIPIPASHKFIPIEVPSTCFKEGTKKHNYCRVCDKAFDFETGLEITDLSTLVDDKLVHEFEFHHENANFVFNKCKHCNEMVKIPKENKANTKSHGGIKSEADEIKEKRADEEKSETNREIVVESVITIGEREISTQLETDIHSNDTETKKASADKIVLEITVETVTKHFEFIPDASGENTVDKENDANILDKETKVHKETPSLIEIEIPIPSEMQVFVDFLVHRMHNGVAQTLTTTPNNDDEYIVISPDKTKVTIFVKKFSEYAVVGYDTKVNPDPVTPSTGGGGGSGSCTIKLNANGGTLLNNVTVKRGQKAELPVPTRSGYVFAGWYLDSNFTTPFDADTVINRNYTLYAKWVELGECEGTVEDNCPCLKYYDLDPTLWYHRGVDYVLNRGMMIGTADTQFAPDWDVTRAMLVTVLWRAEGKPAAASSTFTDLEDGLYYVDAVNWAAANGVVNGYSETAFAPNDAITREQFAAIMYRYAKAKGYDVSVGENTNILSYSDYSEISEYAIPAMQYTAGSGLIKGRTETTLNPKYNTTRAEMATILYRFFTEQ